MPNTWVVVADSAAARLFRAPSPTGPLEEFESYAHAEGRAHVRDLVTDPQGRQVEGFGPGNRSGIEPRVDPKEQEKVVFARMIADRVRSARSKGEVNRVILVAPPEFLGHLRSNLDGETRRLVEGEFGLNIVRMRPEDIRSRLPEKLYSALAR
ncbi:MAG TPA: host attachment protein [Casimicrobiaceae bacterium]|nr:host attachment protein [Casimicrobiaceae bacterium]